MNSSNQLFTTSFKTRINLQHRIRWSVLYLYFIFSLFTPHPLYSQRSLATLEDDMVLVEGGSFIMGGLPGRDDKNGMKINYFEQPPHNISITSFYISKYEVTQQLWQEVMGSNPAFYRSCGPLCPVEEVSWYDAVEFCNTLSTKLGLKPCYIIDKKPDPENQRQDDNLRWHVSWDLSGNGYRLPCEAEWEYTARGGNKSKGFIFSGSDNIDEVAWYKSNTAGKTTQNVATKKANELGCFDFSGNVNEWVYDINLPYGLTYYFCDEFSGYGANRSKRGGSFSDELEKQRTSNKINYYNYFYPFGIYHDTGLRLSRTVRL